MSAVLERCRLAGIRLRLEDSDLRYEGPKGAMTPALAAEIRTHKPAILAALAHPDPLPPLSRKEWEREDTTPEALWWRVAITEPGGRTVEVDTPHGWTLPDWQAYALRYHDPGCAVTAIAGLPKPRASVNLDEALHAGCEGVAGITPAQFRALLSPEDVADVEAGAIHTKTLRAYAESFAEGIRSGRIAVLSRRTP